MDRVEVTLARNSWFVDVGDLDAYWTSTIDNKALYTEAVEIDALLTCYPRLDCAYCDD